MTRSTIAILLALGFTAARGGEAGFAVKPQTSGSGGKTVVTFGVNAKTDVAVSVLDAKGKVVRHLAAGVLGGEKAPPPPLKKGLAQKLEWDGKDDYGKTAAGGPFRVRVALGLKPQFDRTIGHKPGCVTGGMSLNRIAGFGVGPDGTLYVISKLIGFGSGSSHASIKAFDRNGKYLRMVAPYPANQSEEKLKGIKRLETAAGHRVPFVYNAETRALLPGLGETGFHRLVVTGDGRLIFQGTMGIHRDKRKYTRLVSIRTDGSVPEKPLINQLNSGVLAVSPDSKTLYASGKSAIQSLHFGGGKAGTVISSGISGVSSMATDGKGNIYVAESGRGQVAVFKPDGSPLGKLKTSSPKSVAVDPRQGTVYVLGGQKSSVLSKFASWKSTKPKTTATLKLGRGKHPNNRMALDSSAEPPVLWVANEKTILRVEDKGAGFGKPSGLADNKGSIKPTDLFVFNGKLHVYSQRGYAGPWVFDAKTGKRVRQRLPKVAPYVGFILQGGADGNYYTVVSGGRLARYKPGPKPQALPFASRKNITGLGNTRTRARGMDIDGQGNIYVLRQKDTKEKCGDANSVAKIGPDGKTINNDLVDSQIRSLNSVRVDPRGNIYLALGARPDSKMLPPHLEGQLPNSQKDPDAESGHNYYPLMYGCIVKFGPEGGKISKKGTGDQITYAWKKKAVLSGAKWSFFGASLVPVFTHGGMKPNICACESPRFDVDGFGRSFFGDACGFRVGVLDSAGNLIKWFGDYGNQDSAGPKSAIPVPAIPIGWVHGVAVDDEACFIGDRLNQRVIRVKLGYDAEAECAIR